MAVGMSIVSVWILWKGVALVMKPNVSWHRHQLKFHGKLKPAGKLVFVLSTVTLLFMLQSAAVKLLELSGESAAKNGEPTRALFLYKLSSPMTDGGIGFASNPNVDRAMSKLLESKGEFQESERLLRRLNNFVGEDETATMLLGQNLQLHREPKQIEQFYLDALAINPKWTLIWEDYVAWLRREGRQGDALQASFEANSLNTNDPRLQLQWQLLHQ
jgi:tetratricopeptide (TPR) repeat protein